jgi:hypothetical protein
MSVVLTNQIRTSHFAGPAIASRNVRSIADSLSPAQLARGFADAAHGFAVTFTVALVLIAITFVPVLLLPRRRSAALPDEAVEGAAPAALMH